MMPQLTTLRPHQITICDNTLRKQGMIAPNRALLTAIISKSPSLMSALVRLYRKPETGFGGRPATLDTMEREDLYDVVSQQYAGDYWPRNGDGHDAMVKFRDTMMENMSRSGWVFVTE